MDNLQNWLKANQLDKYSEVLLQNDITNIELLNELTEDDLKELGFSMGDRKGFAIAKKSLVNNTVQLTSEELELIKSLPYVIAYPLKRTLLEKHPWTKINLLKDTFLNYLKYLGLLSASEFFNSDIKDKGMVDLFHKNLMETAFGKWNHYIRESLLFLKQKNHTFFYPELVAYYELVETGNKSKKYKGEIEYQDANGDTQLIVQTSITSIGMLINFRNRYLGHGQTLDEDKSLAIWNEYYPIFKHLLEQLNFTKDYPMLKREEGETYLLHTAEIKTIETLSKTNSNIWIENKEGQTFDILPFFIVPGEVSLAKEDKEQLLTYESYTGKTIKFFSPEGTEKQTSGKILEKLNLLLRDKQKETPFTPEAFTKEEFLKRIAEENKLLIDTLIAEKKIIHGVYQNREEMEIKLREWIGARANIFFIAAEAGSGKTNLLAEIQRQYAERELPSLLIRAGRMEKQTLKQQIAYLLNIDLSKRLENYKSITGTQAHPTFILIDGLNEANNSEEIWQEIIELSKLFDPGSIKFVVTNRANTKVDLERYVVSDSENYFLYGENNDNEKGLSAYTYWLTALDMKEMKGAWENYVSKDKSRFKPLFSFDDIANFDRALYNQINNPLILRLFLEIYNGKHLPKKRNKHLHVWQDWLKTFNTEEQTFLKLVVDEIWLIGKNELLLDDLLKLEKLKPYFTSDIISGPYNRLKNNGWISRYVKDLNGYIGFTVEGALFYLLGTKLINQIPEINIDFIHTVLKNGTKFQKAAIESFLCEKALHGNLDLVANLIDAGNDDIELSITPLIFYLKTFGVKATIEKVLENPTDNDWKAFLKLEGQLEEFQLSIIRKEFLKEVIYKNPFHSKESLWLGIRAMNSLEVEQRAFYESKIDLSLPNFVEDANVLDAIGIMKSEFGEYDKALNFHQNALSIQLKNLYALPKSTAHIYLNIGTAYDKKGNHESASEFYQKGLDILLKTLGQFDSDVAESYLKIGMNLDDKGEYDSAFVYYQRCLDIQLKVLGSEHPDVADTYRNFGFTWHNKGDFDKALEYYHYCLEIQLKTLSPEHSGLATTFNNIGASWHKKNNLDKALLYYQNCLNIELKNLGSQHPDVATCYNNIGYLFYSKKEYDKALEFHYNSLNIRLRSLGNNHSDVAISYLNIGLSFVNKGDYDHALILCQKSLDIRLKNLGSDHPSVAQVYSVIGKAWQKKGQFNKALDFYKKCLDIRIIKLGINDERTKNSRDKVNLINEILGKNN
jgi:tetratricopeptide (TPR) repeat protein